MFDLPWLQVERAAPGFFRMDVQRQREHKCEVPTCKLYNTLARSGQLEAWVAVLAENEPFGSATAQQLLRNVFAEEWLAEGLRCEACGGNKKCWNMQPQSVPLQFWWLPFHATATWSRDGCNAMGTPSSA